METDTAETCFFHVFTQDNIRHGIDELRIDIPSTDRPAEPQPDDPQNESQAQWTHVRYSQEAWRKLKDKVLMLCVSCRH